MFPITHALAPLVIVKLYERVRQHQFNAQFYIATALAGVLPDLLNIHIKLGQRASWSHSVLVLPLLLILAFVIPKRFRRYAATGLLGFSTHIALDIFSNPYNFLYPLQFSYSIDLLSSCGLGLPAWWMCWYAFDILFLAAFLLLEWF